MDPSVRLRCFVPSVASINSPDLPPISVPDRAEPGGDSFSSMLDATAPAPEDPGPQAQSAGDSPSAAPRTPPTPPASNPAPAPSRASDSQPADDRTAPPQGDCGAKSAGEASDGPAKAGDDAADGKPSAKDPKSPDDREAKAVTVALDPNLSVSLPVTPVTPITPVAAVAPPAAETAEALKGMLGAKATNPTLNLAPSPPMPTPTPAGAATPPNVDGPPNAGATPQSNKGASVESEAGAAATAAVEVGAASAADPKPDVVLAEAGDAPDTSAKPNAPRSAAINTLTENVASEAAKNSTVLSPDKSSDLPSKPLTAVPPAGDPSTQPASAKAEPDKSESVAAEVAARPAAKGPEAPTTPSKLSDLQIGPNQQGSASAQVSASAALPEPLRVLTASLTPASPPQAPLAAPGPGVPLIPAAIAVEIAARAQGGSRQFDIRLDPPELGRIDVRLDVNKSGDVSTRLTVDRPETLQLLQNDARGLERALQAAGLKTDDGSLQFSLRQQSSDGSAGQQTQSGSDPRPGTVYIDDENAIAAGLEQYQWAASLRGGVDIRV
jgi:flagellar hook-length control protein FliK